MHAIESSVRVANQSGPVEIEAHGGWVARVKVARNEVPSQDSTQGDCLRGGAASVSKHDVFEVVRRLTPRTRSCKLLAFPACPRRRREQRAIGKNLLERHRWCAMADESRGTTLRVNVATTLNGVINW